MVITDIAIIAAFLSLHSDAAASMASWLLEAQAREWANPNQMKQSFGSASVVSPWTVFNIGGNKYRMVTQIDYSGGIIYIDCIVTHDVYSRMRLK